MGSPIGNGLSAKSAQELGLMVNTPVAVSAIDAHAGGLGMIGENKSGLKLHEKLSLIGGTSA
eukprot:CAMPEP_0117419362 /NCGR_PEP_ID=MMETSP0758-20121206/940_1 /TAXON_ID=63605 /ORGANISM="Percolomonas cosmopolitus, Strain AE-1 (ATCC 50343)" /LENGTH=61 /DNA_ID=CAMNT_0005200383 /DNA_START=277 /DNA_END=458 /DNA_ORIENTATION=+